MTIRTVAEDAGVSVAAVSKVIRDAYGVSGPLREKVTASIERLGYRPSTAARGMRGQTFTIGLLLVGIDNPFLPDVIEGVNTVLVASRYKAMIGVGRARLSIEQALIESMIDYRMDGLILIGPRLAGSSLEAFARQIPMVVIGHHEQTAQSFDTVNSDDRLGAAIAVRSLVEAGHQDIAMISPPEAIGTEFDVYRKREDGYREAMGELGLSGQIRIFRCREEPSHSDIDLNGFLSSVNRPRAVFCWSDLHAVPLLNAAHAHGVAVPGDLAIVGYDNSPLARLPMVGLSSLDQSPRTLGSLAASNLLERIAGRTLSKHEIVEPQLIRRTSC